MKVKIKSWDEMASNAKMENGDINFGERAPWFVQTMEKRMPQDRIIDVAYDELRGLYIWEDSTTTKDKWFISENMIEDIKENNEN